MNLIKIKKTWLQSAKPIIKMFPFFLWILLLVSLINSTIPKEFYSKIFKNNILIDSILGTAIGGISIGNSITSYIIGGEFLQQWVNLVAITAFLVSWVTIGVFHFVPEAYYFGKKFTIIRNILSFIFSILIAIITVLIYENV